MELLNKLSWARRIKGRSLSGTGTIPRGLRFASVRDQKACLPEVRAFSSPADPLAFKTVAPRWLPRTPVFDVAVPVDAGDIHLIKGKINGKTERFGHKPFTPGISADEVADLSRLGITLPTPKLQATKEPLILGRKNRPVSVTVLPRLFRARKMLNRHIPRIRVGNGRRFTYACVLEHLGNCVDEIKVHRNQGDARSLKSLRQCFTHASSFPVFAHAVARILPSAGTV